ncbi:MAG: DNA polymerase III subunit beta [Prochloraceae cyanobacterium]|nr:DNA polymerase III subunit beta [Prochloraceae cyanobacterium]
MKIVCSQNELKNNLSLVSRVVPSRPTHPVLGNVLLVADDRTQQISLTGYDLNIGIRTSFSAEVIDGGKITLPAKLLNDIVSRLLPGEITLAYQEEDDDSGEADTTITYQVTLTSASANFEIRGLGAEEFPDLPVIEGDNSLDLPIDILSEGLQGTLFAASTEEIKKVLTGINLCVTKDRLEFAATDSHRLAVVSTEIEDCQKNFTVTIPAKALRELEKMLSGQDKNELVKLNFDESQIVFEIGDRYLTTRKIDEVYPQYEKLIPTKFEITVTLERKRLISGLELVSVLATQNNNLVKFNIDKESEELFLSVESQDLGSAEQSMPAQITGSGIQIGFNVKYLMDGLKALTTNDIKMQLNGDRLPVIFTPLGDLQMTYLVMPVQLRD